MIKVAALLFVLLFSSPAHAFLFINNGGYNRGARTVANGLMWSGRTLTFYVNTNQRIMGGSVVPELDTTEFQSAITLAVAAWNNTCGTNLRVVVGGTTNNVMASGDLVNTIMWDDRTTAEGSYRQDTDVLAFASPNVSGDTVIDCDVVVNGESSGTFTNDGSGHDLRSILIHEIGHCLGLDHTAEPPDYTSSNSILLNSVMFAGLSAADVSKRALSQDELDFAECIYPNTNGFAARGGFFCTSYHGSTNGAAVSGTLSGGPASTRTCGDGQSAAVTKSTSSGGGCMAKAIAADGSDGDEPFEIGWALLFPLLAIFFLRKRIISFFLSIAIAVSFAQPAIANVELSYSITRASPSAVKSATAMTAAEGSFNSTTADPEKSYDSFDDLYAAISYADTPASTWGLFYKKQQPEKSELSGKNSAGTVLVKKSSTLEGWTLGLARKYYWQDRASRGLNLFLEMQLAVGSVSFNQKITDTTAVVSKIEGTAFAFETNAYLGFQYPLWGMLDGLIKVGYARMHSNYFTVKSVSGSRYGTLQAGDRMAIRAGGQDMRLERDGYSAQLGITYSFSGSGGGGAAPPPP